MTRPDPPARAGSRSSGPRQPRVAIAAGLAACALAAGAPLLFGCGESGAPETRLEDAGERLTDAREDASEAHGELREARQRLEAAEAEVQDARKAVRAAEKRVLSARALVERRATDVALFRGIQARLLDAESLSDEAIMVRVDDGVVSLEGTVSDAAARETALALVESTPGVSLVRDRLALASRAEPDDADPSS